MKTLFENIVDVLAVAPCDETRIPDLVDRIISATEEPFNEARRLRLLHAARSLVQALETPQETVIRLCWAEPTLHAALMTTIQLDIFRLMRYSTTYSVEQLSGMTDVDPLLLRRLMKHLAAMGVINEEASDQYSLNNLSQTLAHPKYADGFPCFAKGVMSAIYKLPEYLAGIDYRNPSGVDGPFQFAYGTIKHWFQWAAENPPVLNQFDNHMSAYHQGRPSWMDPNAYPIEDHLLAGTDIKPDDILLVDVGGSLGHDLGELLDKHPTIPGRLILQDTPAMIQKAKNYNGRVELMAHDLFTEQPVKGARAYYMRSVLHNWPDEDCTLILQRIVSAMKPGYSKLLINENVVPDVGADLQVTAMDLMVMTLFAARERSEQDWIQLLEEAGLRILSIWSYENSVESLIECEVA